ncbi:MAG: hypothetical protein GIW99_03370 [Candidatus Eremiobacteraeota bacterium]|nr:hypothetical protein [Candidatus Eremiobacteraeota bacterium]
MMRHPKQKLRRRGSSSWALVIDNTDEHGKRKRRWISIGATAKREAEQQRIRILRELQTGVSFDHTRVTLRDFLAQWLEHEASRITARSLERYETVSRKYITPAIGGIQLAQLTPAHVQAFYNASLRQGTSSHIVRYCHVTLHAALRHALRLQIIGRNVCDSIQPPRGSTSTAKSQSDAELAAILRAAKDTVLEIAVYLQLHADFGAANAWR